MQNVTALYGGPIGVREPDPEVIETLEKLLEAARAGEIVGIMAASVCYDRLGRYDVAGKTANYAIVGACETGKMELMRGLGELPDAAIEED